MVPASQLLAFALAAAVIIAIPGPSVLFTVGRSLALGRRSGVLSAAGNTLGTAVVSTAVALGLGVLVAESVVLLTAVKIIGALYLVFLGVQTIRHRHASTAATLAGQVRAGAFRTVRQSFVVGVSNPKTIAFFIAVLPQFVEPRAGSVPLQMVELGVVFCLIAFLSDSVWAIAAGSVRAWFTRSPRRLSRLTATGGGMIAGLGVILGLSAAERV